jgi:hypothetical protein
VKAKIDNVKAKINNIKAKIHDKEEKRHCSRPTLARRPVFGQMAASPTSSPRVGSPRQVSASHDKSPPRTTTRRLRLVRGPWRVARARGASTTTDARGGTVPHAMQGRQLAAMQAAHPNKSLNAGLTGCATIPSPSSLTLPHTSSARGTQSPSTMRTKPRLRLGCGGLGKYSGRLRQAQTTQRRSQASQNEQSDPTTRRLPRRGIATRLQCTLADNDV